MKYVTAIPFARPWWPEVLRSSFKISGQVLVAIASARLARRPSPAYLENAWVSSFGNATELLGNRVAHSASSRSPSRLASRPAICVLPYTAGSVDLRIAAGSQKTMPTVTVDGEKSFEVEPGKKLVLAIEDAGIDIMHKCGGNARCTTCRVEILGGEVADPGQVEQALCVGGPCTQYPALLPDSRPFRSLGLGDQPGISPGFPAGTAAGRLIRREPSRRLLSDDSRSCASCVTTGCSALDHVGCHACVSASVPPPRRDSPLTRHAHADVSVALGTDREIMNCTLILIAVGYHALRLRKRVSPAGDSFSSPPATRGTPGCCASVPSWPSEESPGRSNVKG